MTTAAPFHHSEAKSQSKSQPQRAPRWNVVVLNDPVNLMPYVVMVFQRVLGFDPQKAKKHMLEVHEEGRSLVWSGSREKAEHFMYVLQQWQLTVILQHARD